MQRVGRIDEALDTVVRRGTGGWLLLVISSDVCLNVLRLRQEDLGRRAGYCRESLEGREHSACEFKVETFVRIAQISTGQFTNAPQAILERARMNEKRSRCRLDSSVVAEKLTKCAH